MASPDRITLAHEGALEIAQKAVLGIVDVAAVGARVLLSLQPPAGWTVRETALNVRGLQQQQQDQAPSGSSAAERDDGERGGGGGHGDDDAALRPVLAAADGTAPSSSSSSSSTSAAVLLRNFYSDGGSASPEVSLLILNTVIPEGAQGEVAAALLELVEGRGGAGADGGGAGPAGAEAGPGGAVAAQSLTLVAAMLLQQLAQPAALYQHLINGAAPLDPALPPLQPPSAAAAASSASAAAAGSQAGRPIAVRDGQLAALLHVLEVSGTPAACLLAPGHKPPSSTSLDLPGAASACDALGASLASAYGLRYDGERCRAVRALYKWFVPEKAAGSDVMYL